MAQVQTEVPWSVAWTGENTFRLQPSHDFPGLTELDQAQARGSGVPCFAAIHVTRQRRGMIDFLCHVCGDPTAPADRYIFPVTSGGMVSLHDGTQRYGCNVPPMHQACAGRAAEACPHLAKVRETPLRCTEDEGRLIHRTDVTPELEALAPNLPRGLDVVFSCYRLYGPAFTDEVASARMRWEAAVFSRRAEDC